MKYDEVQGLKPAAFKRLAGVKPQVFNEMLAVLREAEGRKKKSGRNSKLSLEDKLLLALCYWREYRTQFHLAASYGVHESTANRIITKVEDVLIASGKFSLPKRREVEETEWTVVLVDVTETPVEKPKTGICPDAPESEGLKESSVEVGQKLLGAASVLNVCACDEHSQQQSKSIDKKVVAHYRMTS